MGKAIFVTGTGTDVGKTYVTGRMVKKLRDAGWNSSYYKAALSGAIRDKNGILQPGDALQVKAMAGLAEAVPELVSYIYEEPVSPHLAALHTGRPIDFQKVQRDFQAARARSDYLTMEGSGGIVCPLRWDHEQHMLLDDLVKELDLAVMIVADAGLGTINGTVLTIEHLRAKSIPVQGVIFNHCHPGNEMEDDNATMIEAMTGIKIVARVPDGATDLDIDAEALAGLYR